jgi:putative DNA primase/helicase
MSSSSEQSTPENDPLSRALWLVEQLYGDTRTGRCFCPSHDDEPSPSFVVNLKTFTDKGDPLFRCYGGCEQAAVIAALRAKGLWPVPGSVPKGSNGPAVTHRSAEDRRQYAIRIYRSVQAQRWPKDLLKPYFASRKLEGLPNSAWVSMPVPRGGEERQYISEDPGIVFGVWNRDKKFLGIHVTWLNKEMTGKREPQPQRQSYGPIGGGFVKLGTIDPDKPLIVAEGIETAIAAMQIAGLPAALVGLGENTKSIELPDHREIIIAADNGDAGQHTARTLAERYAGDRVIRIATPVKPEGGKSGWDWNDALMGGPLPRAKLILEAPVFERTGKQ